MPTVELGAGERAAGVSCPGLQQLRRHPMITAPTDRVDVGVDADLRTAAVSVEGAVVGLQRQDQELDEVLVVEQARIGAAEIHQIGDQAGQELWAERLARICNEVALKLPD